jgi:phosphatidate cytidylyltransferase
VLRYRLIVGTILIAAFAALCWADANHALGTPAGAWLLPLAVLLSIPATGEALNLLAVGNQRPNRVLTYVGNFLIVAVNGITLFGPDRLHNSDFGVFAWPIGAFALVVIALFIGEIIRYRAPGRATINLGTSMLALVYVGLFLTFVVQIAVGPHWHGLLALLSLIIMVKMGDTGAYTVGRLIGRHKMTPHLSPGKTWEGAAGALLFAVLGSWIVFYPLRALFISDVTTAPAAWQWICYGLILGVVGMLGDLAESLLKRDAGKKDSSTWMPGLGGVLDVLDSILFAAPVAYICWASGLVY